MPGRSLDVAVIGGGAAGLAAARILSRNGFCPVVLEKDQRAGGIWDYQGSNPERPMYRGLRTNLPREIMAYREFPWPTPPGATSFATHSDVLNYLHEYKEKFELDRFIVYGAKVIQLSVLLEEESGVKVSTERLPKFLLEWEQVNGVAKTLSKTFDAVCIANGHYDRPSVPRLEGLDKHRGRTMHSVEYDSPECFAGETVLCIGGQASGSDLAREISQYALHVYLSVSSAKGVETRGNVTCVPRTVAVDDDGCVAFGNNCGLRTKADTIIFCTGYEYQFPFINSRSNLKLSVVSGERRVTPLYKQLWHADFPNLSFIGVPHSVVPFPLFELQVEAFVQQIIMDGDKIPAKAEREEHALRDAVGGGANKTGRVEDTHYLGSAQWDYCRDLAAMAHLYDNAMERYISTNRAIYEHSKGVRATFPAAPDSYRDFVYSRDDSCQGFHVVAKPDSFQL